jgi:hypothetical protein
VVRVAAGFSSSRLQVVLPQSKATQKGVDVVSAATSLRESFQFFDVASAENHVIEMKGADELAYAVRDLLPPFVLAESL